LKKKVLILGASGFIGSNVALHLSKNKKYDLFGTYSSNFPKQLKNINIKLIKCDLTDKKTFKKLKINHDIVIQAAAITSGAKDILSKPYIHVNDNAIINSFVTRSAFDNKAKHIIFFSCSIMYKSSKKQLKEKDFNPNNEMYPNYFGGAWMKIYVEKLCEFYSRLGRNKYTVIRHSNVYGPYDKYDLDKSHVFGATITKVLKNKDGIVKIWGDGKEGRDFIFIDDLLSFVDLAIKKQKRSFEIFNVGSGKLVSINNLVKNIIELSNKKLSVSHIKSRKGLKNNVMLNWQKAYKQLGWEPKVDLISGIKKTIEWYKINYK